MSGTMNIHSLVVKAELLNTGVLFSRAFPIFITWENIFHICLHWSSVLGTWLPTSSQDTNISIRVLFPTPRSPECSTRRPWAVRCFLRHISMELDCKYCRWPLNQLYHNAGPQVVFSCFYFPMDILLDPLVPLTCCKWQQTFTSPRPLVPQQLSPHPRILESGSKIVPSSLRV